MPSCFVKNCKNRTNVLFIKNVKFYSVPKDPELRIKWLEACQRDKDCMMKCERVCEVHFLSNCFEEQMTKGKLKRKLKAGSIPTELLQLPKERQKRIHTNNTNNAGLEKSVRTAIPTYAELVECATKETENESIPENTTFNKPEAVEDVSMENIDLTHNVQDATEKRKPEEVLSKRFKALEKENEQLTQTIRRMEEDANIREKQIATNILRSETLEKENEQLTQTIRRMEKDANIRGEQIATNILHSVFAPAQVKRIVSPQNRANWSIEDITSAIALRSVSARAYNYLREVRKIPLPCVSTLRRWISEFQVNPGILYEF